MKKVLILSGGLDSTTLLYDQLKKGNEIFALSFEYGQKHIKELYYAKKTCKKLGVVHKIVDLKSTQDLLKSSLTNSKIAIPEGHYQSKKMKITVVPSRNLIMLSIALGYAISIGAKKVLFGAHSGDHAIYPDCRPEFVQAMNEVSKLANFKFVKVEAPYLSKNKKEIVEIGKTLNVPFEETWTCYQGKSLPCGKCGSCIERKEAFGL